MVAPLFAVWLSSFVDKMSRTILPRIGREFRFDNKRVSILLELSYCGVKNLIDMHN